MVFEERITYGLTENVRKESRKKRKVLNSYVQAARKEDLPICYRCMKLDYDNGKLNESWKHYSDIMNHRLDSNGDPLVGKDVVVNPITGTETVKNYIYEYECNQGGHRNSVFVNRKLSDKDKDQIEQLQTVMKELEPKEVKTK